VSFPASPTFGRIGRVTIAGLGLRLGIGVSDVERLRTAADHAIDALSGTGRISLEAFWEPGRLVLRLVNPDVTLDWECQTALKQTLVSSLDDVSVTSNDVVMTLHS